MSSKHSTLPSTGRLFKATAIAIAVAGAILLTTVLPAEYGIDPTGIGNKLGLDVLATPAEAAEVTTQAPAATPKASTDADAAEKAKSAQVFGANPGQTFETAAVARRDGVFRRDTMSVELAPGKGAEIKALMKAGDSFVFHWTASGDVAVDMHGELIDAKDAYTSYWIEGAQREGSGTFNASFAGKHGWYWKNRSSEPVTVQIEVVGYQEKLFRPGH